MYLKYTKRIMDFLLSCCAVIVLTPLLIILTVVGAIVMKGNPFFTQERPGWHEKIFRLVKFRTMSNERDQEGNLLPDDVRLNGYGKWLRRTSLDELPELLNIMKGDMSIVGPRPLLVEYLPYYNDLEKHRHDVRPGLTGLAQISGRNNLNWNERFMLDVEYVHNINLKLDIKIIFMTIKKIVSQDDILEDTSKGEPNFATERKAGRL